ncbi:MAG TPA: hypothetical protein DDZ55_05370, partial [Firmicutes bacterium]|nr:hypothetical protein [Bacillota bacterium]
MKSIGQSNENYGFPPSLAAVMRSKGIDLKLTRAILTKYNAGAYDHFQPVQATGFPRIDGERIIDLTGPLEVDIDLAA